MRCNSFKKIFSVLICFVLLLTYISYPNSATATTLEDLQNISNALEQKVAANKQKLAELQKDINNKEAYIETLTTNIQYTQSQIDNLSSQIDIINAQIKEVETSINNKKAEREAISLDISTTDSKIKAAEGKIKKTYNALSSRLRSAYMSGNDSNLKLLLGSENIATFLTRLEMMKIVSENDAALINSFKAEIEVLKLSKDSLTERTKALIEQEKQIAEDNRYLYTKRNELNQKMYNLNNTKKELDASYKAVQSVLASLDQSSAYYQNIIAKQEKEMEEADKAIENFLATQGSKTDGQESNATYMFPLKFSGVYMSSKFGWRTLYGKPNNHGGIDLTAGGIYGASIYASRSGKVITAEKYSNSGYGHYVIIDHGDGYATLYGHCSSVLVNVGQMVNQGDVIAKVGSTGNSTGAHLHFEVRKNGVKQDPLNYVKLP